MNKHGLTLIFALLLSPGFALAQPTGCIHGTVTCADGYPASGATVRIDCYSSPFHSSTVTATDGSFEWSGLQAGTHFFTAMLLEHGFAVDSRSVAAGETTYVILNLEIPVGDSLAESWVYGTTLVEPPNGSHSLPWYFADVNDDQIGDYRLSFGPPWYDPPSVDRPLNSSELSVTGGLFSYADTPMLIVHLLGDTIWREAGVGHGGFGGSQGFYSLVCHTLDTSGTSGLLNPSRIEVKSLVLYDLCGPDTVTPPGVFDFASAGSWEMSYHLNYGMNRPIPFDLFDTLFVVGGLVDVTGDDTPWIIVYECNGHFWREPGDTTGLAPMGGNAADPPAVTPSSFVLSAYPNPFNSTTALSFTLPQAGHVALTVFDLTGREVESLLSANMAARTHTVTYSPLTASSGIYFARLETASRSVTQKLVLLK